MEIDLRDARDLDLDLASLQKAATISLTADVQTAGNARTLIKALWGHCRRDVIVTLTLTASSTPGTFLDFCLALEEISAATLAVDHETARTRVTFCKPDNPHLEADLASFESRGHSITLRYPTAFDLQRRFPVHMGQFYEQELLDFIATQKFDGVILDVGANIGNHSVFFGLMGKGPVYSFEPSPDIFSILQQNIQANGLEKTVHAAPVALGAESGSATIANDHTHNSGASRLSVQHGGDITVITLDDFMADSDVPVGLIKIDAEGMEEQVIRGARHTLARYKPLVFAEALDKGAEQHLKQLMAGLGYHFIQSHCRTPMLEFRAEQD